MSDRIALLVGTPKGAFIFDGDADRRSWELRGPLCEGWPVHDISVEPGTGALLAGAGSPWFGPAVWRSEDLGRTWTHSSEGLTYGDDGPKVATVWNVTAAPDGTIYAGVEPAGLFRSTDRGATWAHIAGLTNHPTRSEWQAGAGGLILHSIVPHPTDPSRVWVGISSVGAFETRDGGATLGDPQQGRARRVLARALPRVRPVRAQAGHGRRRGRAPVPAEPLRRLPLARRRAAVGGDHIGPADRLRVPDGRAPAGPDDGVDDPAQRRRSGEVRTRREAGRLAHGRRW